MSTLSALTNGHRVPRWAWWLLPAVALAAVLGWETDWGRQVVRTPAAPPPAEPKPVAAAVLPDYQIEGGLAGHRETVERTLFNATRRPAPVATADSGPKRLTASQFQLTGTAVAGDRNLAFLKELAGGKSRVVKQGDEVNGMKVALVLPDRVRFTLGDEADELILKVAPGPKTTLAAAPPPPAAPGAAPAALARGGPARAQGAGAQATAVQPAEAQPQQDTRAARRAARAAGRDQEAGRASRRNQQ